MKADYFIHDRQYMEARARGWHGWGGNERMAHEHVWLERLFAYDRMPHSGDALELGCGEGHYARLLAEMGYRVTGVDISPTAIQWAKEKTLVTGHDIEYLEMDLTQSGVLPERAFDLIADGNCLHCIIGQDRQTFLANVHRLLKAQGVFFVYSKCNRSDSHEIVEFDGKPYRYVPGQGNLHLELEAAGFEIKRSDFHCREIGEYGHCTVHLTRRQR